MSKLLEIKNLNLCFQGEEQMYQVLWNVNLSFEKGMIHSLVGESGCGKTMTAMSVMRLLPKNSVITSGEVIFNDEDLLKYKESQMRNLRGNKIALIPQDPMTSLDPLYTIGNQIVESIQAHSKVTKRQALRKAREVLDMVKIPDVDKKLNYYPHEFSGGMKQRVIIAMALACNAELIIADEPTTALDVTIQAQIMDLILELNQQLQMGVMLITHDLAVVAETCTRAIVMYLGQVVEEASVEDLFQHPMHPYTQGLIASVPRLYAPSKERLHVIEGTVPFLNDIPTGCRFAPRCAYATDHCYIQMPELVTVGNQKVRCWRVCQGGGVCND